MTKRTKGTRCSSHSPFKNTVHDHCPNFVRRRGCLRISVPSAESSIERGASRPIQGAYCGHAEGVAEEGKPLLGVGGWNIQRVGRRAGKRWLVAMPYTRCPAPCPCHDLPVGAGQGMGGQSGERGGMAARWVRVGWFAPLTTAARRTRGVHSPASAGRVPWLPGYCLRRTPPPLPFRGPKNVCVPEKE